MKRVSVIVPAYHHERFIAPMVRSLLDQDYSNLEIVICDDASPDDTLGELRKFKDPRLKILTHEINLGACSAAQYAVSAATGDYLARLGSDDVCLPGRIAKQAAYLDAHPEIAAVFGQVEFINDEGAPIPPPTHFATQFSPVNRTRQDWLKHFFEHGNSLCNPTAMIRRSSLETVPLDDRLFHHLPDFQHWVRLCRKHEIHVLPDKLSGFRVHTHPGNLSVSTLDKRAEEVAEYLAIWRLFLEPTTLHDMGLPAGIWGRMALAEWAARIGGVLRLSFAAQTILETPLHDVPSGEAGEFYRRAQPMLRHQDFINLLALEAKTDKIRELNQRVTKLKSQKLELREKLDRAKGELQKLHSSPLLRWLAKRISKKEPRP